jgi:hypothetical protein
MGVRVMRTMAWGAISLMCLAAAPAAAQTRVSKSAQALREAAFAPRTYKSGEIRLKQAPDGAVDSLRVNVASALRLTAGLPIADSRTLDITLIRTWPQAFSLATDSGLEFDVSPHAGFGFSSRGGQAEAGAMVKVSKSRGAAALEQLRDMGVQDGTSFGDAGRWYLFAAASGRAVGLNMTRGEDGWDRSGWSTDETTDLVGDAQIGVGWRKGDVQSSFGVIHREVKGRHMYWRQQTRDDTVAAFTFTIKPTN